MTAVDIGLSIALIVVAVDAVVESHDSGTTAFAIVAVVSGMLGLGMRRLCERPAAQLAVTLTGTVTAAWLTAAVLLAVLFPLQDIAFVLVATVVLARLVSCYFTLIAVFAGPVVPRETP